MTRSISVALYQNLEKISATLIENSGKKYGPMGVQKNSEEDADHTRGGHSRRGRAMNFPPDITAELNSQQPRLGKAIATVSNDDVIQYPDINQRQGTLDPLSNPFIRGAGFYYTAGMVVCQDNGSSVRIQCSLDDLAGVDCSPIDGAAEYHIAFQYLVLAIE